MVHDPGIARPNGARRFRDTRRQPDTMLRFIAFTDEGTPDQRLDTAGAFAFGPGEVPMQAEITSAAGVVTCQPRLDGAAGLSVLADVTGPDGLVRQIRVQTCLLPPRERPYLFWLEIARRQVMRVLNRLEDWSLFDLPTDHPAMAMFAEGREQFSHALVGAGGLAATAEDPHPDLSAESDRLARLAVGLIVEAGEQLALEQARRDMDRRISGRGYRDATDAYTAAHGEPPPPDTPVVVQNTVGVTLPGTPLVGVRVSPKAFAEPLHQAALSACDFISLPMRWNEMEPEESKYDYAPTDRWIEWAVRKAKLPVHAGPVVDFSPECLPEYLYIWENDYEELREVVHEHVRSIVTRYRRTVTRWTIASGLHVNTNFTLTYDQLLDLTRLCVLLVRRLQPGAKVYLGLDQLWGEHYADNRYSLPALAYAQAVADAGVHVDGLSLRLMFGTGGPGTTTRDLMSIAAMLDRCAELEKPLAISVAGVPSQPMPDNAPRGGWWRGGWTPESQAAWLERVLAIAASKPYVQSVCWAELLDPPSASPTPGIGLITRDGKAKPALARLAALRNAIHAGRAEVPAQ